MRATSCSMMRCYCMFVVLISTAKGVELFSDISTPQSNECSKDRDCGVHSVCVTALESGKATCVCEPGYALRGGSVCASKLQLRVPGVSSTSEKTTTDDNSASAANVAVSNHVEPVSQKKLVVSKNKKALRINIGGKTAANQQQPEILKQSTSASTIKPVALAPLSTPAYCPDLNEEDLPRSLLSTLQNNRCYGGGSCLRDSESLKSYCICPRGRGGLRCQTILSTADVTNITQLSLLSTMKNSRFVNQRSKDTSTISRQKAENIFECRKICLEAKHYCRAINYGPMNSIQICELLAITPTRFTSLQTWIKKEYGWTHECCF